MTIEKKIAAITFHAMNETEMIQNEGHSEWDFWFRTKDYPEWSINLFCNGEGPMQATMYLSTSDGIDSDSDIDLF